MRPNSSRTATAAGALPAAGAFAAAGAFVAAGALLLAILAASSPGERQELAAGPCDDAPPSQLPASRDLYCVELVAGPGIDGVSGRVELRRIPGPFSVSSAPDGRLRYQAVLRVSGLPDPSELGDASTFVLWLSPPLLYPVRKLGEVGNGTFELGVIELNKYLFLVSAEPSTEVEEPTGRFVLRGQSPSSRMQPADFLEFLLGAAPLEGESGEADGWPRVPVPERVTMLPAVKALRPGRTPYLPEADPGEELPEARPRELIRLADGDSLALEAVLVRRTIGGRSFVMYGFNGQIPGPLLQVPQEATVTVRFTNRIDWPTTIHWHGVRLENAFDGVPGVTQEPIPPGGRFTYRIHFRDAGIYWYHPHIREDIQQDLGLSGNMLVRSPRPDYYGPAHREEVLMLDDLLVGDEGLVPFGLEGATHMLMGRFGNVFLVNGEPDYALDVKRGEVARFFFTNVSNTRTFNLSFGGAPMKVVGSDVGNYEREAWAESLVIGPAERYVVHVRFAETGTVPLLNRVQGIDHVNGRFFPEEDTLARFRVGPERVETELQGEFDRLRRDEATVREIDRFRDFFDRPVDRRLVLDLRAHDLPLIVQRLLQVDSAYFSPVEWSGTMPMMNWISTSDQIAWILRDPETGRENMEIDWRFEVGDVVKIRLSNRRETLHAMQHPIHLHGQRFLILAQNGVANDNLVWKDTVILPVGSNVDLLLELSNPGKWMLHCHIAEHLESGMRMVFTVDSAAAP